MAEQKRKVKYHPKISEDSDSIILKEALVMNLEQINKSIQPSKELIDALSKIKEASPQLPPEYLNAIEQIRIATQPSNELLVALRKVNEASQPSKEYLKAIDHLKKTTQQFGDLSTALTNIKKATHPPEKYLRAIDSINKSIEPSTEILETLKKTIQAQKETIERLKAQTDTLKKMSQITAPAPVPVRLPASTKKVIENAEIITKILKKHGKS